MTEIHRLTGIQVEFLKWVKEDGHILPREFRIFAGAKARVACTQKGLVVWERNRYHLTDEGEVNLSWHQEKGGR